MFSDINALEIFDSYHSSEVEDRYIILGLATSLNMLVVVYAEKKDFSIRIISARKANRWETTSYEKKI
jgi:uncharacterized protein